MVPDVRQTVDEVKKIVDAAEMLTRHNQVAKLLISQGVQALKDRDPAKINDRDALAMLKAGIEIQRLTEGLATERQTVTHDGGVEIKVTRRIIRD